MVANWDSNEGYAWWLMESFWVALAERYRDTLRPIVAYPSISEIPAAVAASPLEVELADFSRFGFGTVFRQLRYLRSRSVRALYLSDQPNWHWAYLLFRLAGVRTIIVHDHTPGVRVPPSGLKRVLKRVLARLPWVNADGYIGATEYIRSRLVQVTCLPEKKCFSAPNGIPAVAPPQVSIHDRIGIPEGRSVIVTAARANHYKGGLFALQAFVHLREETPDLDWHYVFCGDGPNLEAFRAGAREHGLEDRVSFPGRVEGVTELFESCTAAFHPSRGEVGYSLSILEYMRGGLPVLVPDNPSVCEATDDGETGLVYAEGDAEAAAAALARLLCDPAATERMGAAAREAVHRKYLLADTHRALIEAVDRVMPRTTT
jgi:glycosyltransferase involved in cell wall biosynthesis